MDADEEVSESFRENIRDFLKELPKDVNTIYVPAISFLDWDLLTKEVTSTARIFRNGTVYYKNPVHNQPIYKPKVVKFPHGVLHYGYIWTRKLRKRKYERSKKLILEHLNNIKNKNSDEYIYYLVQLYKVECIGGKVHERRKVGWKVFEEIKRIGRAPLIALEFLFLFGMDLVSIGLFDLAKEMFETAISARKDFPDPYFGLLVVHYNKKNYEEAIKWGEKFFEVYNNVLSKIALFEWTIMSMKYIQAAHLIMSHLNLYLGNLKEGKKHLHLARKNKSMENVEAIVKNIKEFLVKTADKKLLDDLKDYIKDLIDFSLYKGLNITWDDLVEKLADSKVKIDFDIPVKSSLARLILEKLKDPSKDFFLDVLMNRSSSEIEFLEDAGVPGVILMYSKLSAEKRNIDLLKKLRHWENSINSIDVKGVLRALIGDVFLNLGNFSEALKNYKKAAELFPEIGRFIKPILEDLKTSISKDTPGVFEELERFFLENKELILDVRKYIDTEVLKRFYLISDNDFAKYVSAVSIEDQKKAIEILESIKEPKKFPYYYHRLAERYKEIDPEKAFHLYNKAVIENPNLADISGGQFRYTGLYPIMEFPLKGDKDEIIWVGNISERFSTLGIINPIRAWRKTPRGLIYADPFPSDVAMKIYEEREKEFLSRKPIEIELTPVKTSLSHVSWEDLNIIPDNEKFKVVAEDFGMEMNSSSKNVLILEGMEKVLSLKDVIPKNAEEALIFLFIPDLNDKGDVLWFYPGFRVFRTIKYTREELRSLGYSIRKILIFGKNLRAILVRKRGIKDESRRAD
ncbi:MAG: glycosyltransferase [Thermoplasmata archaeon]|nr:glycosyltransferase [Thermoplasmata archaeon]